MTNLDQSQQAFCRSNRHNIRLLAPAGCGKTLSLLYRCRELAQRSSKSERFLIVTFTKSAAAELKERITVDSQFDCLIGKTTINTLNAYGWRQIRENVRNPKLLTKSSDYHFAMLNQLRRSWLENQHIEPVVTKGRRAPRRILEIIDNLKSMGFDHTIHINRDKVYSHLQDLERQGLEWRIKEQFELLTQLGVLDSSGVDKNEGRSRNRRAFYDRFFTFWRKGCEELLKQLTFTFEDQKYWAYLHLKGHDSEGKRKRPISGAARYDHILVDEFQDINPLDLGLVKAIRERHRATLTIVGDDDQAIFEWRGATPEYILNPDMYFDVKFRNYQLQINYRSPKEIVNLSQKLIKNNQNRVPKNVSPSTNASSANIEIKRMSGISERLKLVTDIVQKIEPERVAVIGRLRRQLIPFQIYFADEGAPFQTAADLDVFRSNAFDQLIELLEIWNRSDNERRSSKAVDDAIKLCNLVYRYPLSKQNRTDLHRHLDNYKPRTTTEAIDAIQSYQGPNLKSKDGYLKMYQSANSFMSASTLSIGIESISDNFRGLNFDWERAEDDIWYTDPPLKQLAEIADKGTLDADQLIDRLERARDQIQEYQNIEEDKDNSSEYELMRPPLNLMTAHRAKGKEFNTVIILDVDDKTWPNRNNTIREIEAERRLFYVAFTRASKNILMLVENDAPLSQFVYELSDSDIQNINGEFRIN